MSPSDTAVCFHNPDLDEIEKALGDGQTFWLDLEAPDHDTIERLGQLLHLHPLTVDDAQQFHERPKREHYDGYTSLVVYGVDPEAESGGRLLREVHLLLAAGWIVSIHRSAYGPLDDLRKKFDALAEHTETFVVFSIIDAVVETFVPVLGRVDDDIDDIEQTVIASPTDAVLQQIFSLKRDIIAMRRVVTPMRDFFARDSDEIMHLPNMKADDGLYFRDLYDTLVRTSDLIDSYRDLLSGATDMYLSTIANRQGEISKQLTIIATIFLPLSFITGFFGQNFTFLTGKVLDQTWTFWVLGLGLLVLSVAVLVVLFRRRGWLSPTT